MKMNPGVGVGRVAGVVGVVGGRVDRGSRGGWMLSLCTLSEKCPRSFVIYD